MRYRTIQVRYRTKIACFLICPGTSRRLSGLVVLPIKRDRQAMFRKVPLLTLLFTMLNAWGEEAPSQHPQGVWGSDAACERWRNNEPPVPEAAVYEIDAQWLQRFMFACYFGDQPPESVVPGEWSVLLVCGEDGIRPYHLTFIEEPEGGLTLRWQFPGEEFVHRVGPLSACSSDHEM